MEVIYRAYDGTIFNSSEVCRQYEKMCLYPKALKRIKAYNISGQQVNITPGTGTDEFDYIYFPDEICAEAFNKLCDENSWAAFSAGTWYWDENANDWINLDDEIKKITEITKIFGFTNKIM